VYPLFSHDTFSGLAAVMLAWPWIILPPRSARFMLVLFCRFECRDYLHFLYLLFSVAFYGELR
jgi:hypothetical protein